MESLYLLVPLSVFIVILAAWVFFGAADSGQFDDLDGPGMRILLDDEDSAATPLVTPHVTSFVTSVITSAPSTPARHAAPRTSLRNDNV